MIHRKIQGILESLWWQKKEESLKGVFIDFHPLIVNLVGSRAARRGQKLLSKVSGEYGVSINSPG